MNVLKQPSGKQDPFIASYGGIKVFNIERNGLTNVRDVPISNEFRIELEENLLIFFTGYTRYSSKILSEQEKKVKNKNSEMISSLNFIKNIADKTYETFASGNLYEYARLMNEHWEYKLKRSKSMSSNKINLIISQGLKNGALAAKIIGAGGGGFVMFVANDKKKLRNKMKEFKLSELNFKFDNDGSQIISRNF